MKFIKLLLVLGILVGLICLGWKLIFDRGEGTEISSAITPATDLYGQKARSVAEICEVLRSGWDENRFHEGLNLISGASELTADQRNSLRDSLANGSFAVIDTLILNTFRNSFNEPSRVSASAAGPLYAGLQLIADSCPNVSHNNRYNVLMNDRRTIDNIYAFSALSFIPSTGITLRLMPDRLVCDLHLENDQQYRERQHRRRRELLTEKNRLADLSGITWLNSTLSEESVNRRLTAGRASYISGQRTVLSNFLNNLPDEPLLRNNPELRQRVVDGLRLLRGNLREFDSRAMRAEVERAAVRINSIRDLPPAANHIMTN